MRRYSKRNLTVGDVIQRADIEMDVTPSPEILNTIIGHDSVLVGIKCDKCEHVVIHDEPLVDANMHFVHVEGTFGYESEHDGKRYFIDLCYNCVASMAGYL